MKIIMLAAAALGLMCGSAFAQGTTGPAAQSGDNTQKPGMKGSRDSTTGLGTDGMNKSAMNKEGTTGSMMKPDASGQGGSGPNSDQSATKSNIK